ncbi:Uncharacterised protein [Chryseobacterium taklimakanense]|uniref:LysM domain-containing protein n=1 Tax=Chryseobacterium taklimakanense TaxID=536441 RepID=A0A239WLF6_9FLAO|nr:LysM peptidoglycan-binding domain-containing protein [Chryseobacterium taklimakanense]SNV34708.1 Uncharacterised protein [Chryseobacterium taklimakanense]
MKQGFEIYKVSPNETLEKIADKFDMNADQLRSFHNLYCNEAGLLWFNSFVGIEKILVPKNFKSAAERKKEHEKYFPRNLLFDGFYHETYQVREVFEDYGNKRLEIEYQLELKIQKEEEDRVVYVHTENHRKNLQPADDKISSISIACMEAINPVGFLLDKEGKLKQLAHPDLYFKRFSEKRKDIEDFHTGEIAVLLFDKFQENLKDEHYIFEKFSSTLLFQSLFFGMNWFHKNNTWLEKKILNINSFPVEIKFQAVYEHEESEFAKTKISGTVAEQLDMLYFLVGKRRSEEIQNPVKANYNVTYLTDKLQKTLNSVEANITFFVDDRQYSSHTLHISSEIN